MNKGYENGSRRHGCTIGEAARASGLTTKTIRYYEQIGLIPKARRRNSSTAPHTGGDRIYSEAGVGQLSFIRHARLVDLSLADIRKLLEIADNAGCPSEQPAYTELLQRHIRKINERINHLLGLHTAVQHLLNRNRRTDSDACSWNTCSCMQPDTAQPGFTVVVAHNGIQGEKSDT